MTMDTAHYQELFEQEATYWWHVGKRRIGDALLGDPGALRTNSLLQDRRVLDLGCGAGFNLQCLRRYGSAVGLDVSPDALRLARQRQVSLLCQADCAEGLPFRAETFDLVTAFDVLEHVREDHWLMAELARVLKPGGRLLVHVPAYPWLYSYWDRAHGHYRRYTRGRLQDLLASASLTVQRLSYCHALTLGPAVLVRWVKEKAPAERESDFLPVPSWMNRLLLGYYMAESYWLRRWNLPCGLSLCAVAQKPQVPAASLGGVRV